MRRPKAGSRFWAEVVVTAQRDERGALTGVAKLTRDVTARREQELALQQTAAELARSNADLQQFAYIASHDLQEPLRMVSSYTQLLARRYAGRLDEDADEFIHYAVDGARRMQALINALLVYARVGSRPLEPHAVDTNAIVDEVIVDLGEAIAESRARIVRDDLPRVASDAVLLHQVFQNLVGNAIKFRGTQPPVVHISVEQVASEHVFSVSDEGIGIEPQHLERIFTIFHRLHSQQEYAGTGIGLAVCRKVIERLGGRIWAESEPGAGTTFRFTLPATSSPD
jgi:light-regulated signal transduction histidine kinase (bacteriophytochrome)